MAIITPLKKLYSWQCWNTKTNGSCGSTGGGYENYKEVDVSSAQFLALTGVAGGSAISLLPAIPITKWYDFKIILEFKAGATAYVGGSTYAIQNFSASYRTIAAATFTGTTAGDIKIVAPTFTSGTGVFTINDPGDNGVWFAASGAAPTAGDGTMRFKIWYTEMTSL